MTGFRSYSFGIAFVAALGVIPSLSNAESLKIVDAAGKTRFLGNVQSSNADIQMIVTDHSGRGLNNVRVELLDQKSNKAAYASTSKSAAQNNKALPADARAALGSPTQADGFVTFQGVQPTTYAAVVSDPNAIIGTINVVEGAAGGTAAAGGAAGGAGGSAGGAAGGAAAVTAGGTALGTGAIVGGTIVGAGVIGGTTLAITEANDDNDDEEATPSPTPMPTASPTPTPTATSTPRPTSTRPASTR